MKETDTRPKLCIRFAKSAFLATCASTEAELMKYMHNASGMCRFFVQSIYDIARKNRCDWSAIHKAALADPMICNRCPTNSQERTGAGGHCSSALQLLRKFMKAL